MVFERVATAARVREQEREAHPERWTQLPPKAEPYVDPVKAGNERYWNETKPIWTESVGVKVMGRLLGRI